MHETREKLAAYAHGAWSGWMRHVFHHGSHLQDGRVVIPKWAVERWKRQMNTPYNKLPQEERDSDRKEADRMVNIMGQNG